MKSGVVLPNLQWVQYPDSVYEALNDLKPQSLEVLVYNPDAPASPVPAHIAVVQHYCQSHPGTTLLLRPYSDQIANLPPTAWAETCYQWCYHWQFAEAELIPANELNIEGMGEDWQRQIGWLRAFVGRWRDLSPMQVHLPALSPSQNYRDGWAAYQVAGLFDLFDVVDLHMYAGFTGDLHAIRAYTDKPLAVTEFNQMPPSVMFDRASQAGAEAAYFFILSGTPDQAKYFLIGSPYYDDFKNWKEAPAVSQDERERYYADLWKRFNVPLNPTSALYKEWTNLASQGTWLGPPMESEHPTENGQYIYQAFANDVLNYCKATGVVSRGLPPLSP